MSPGTGLPVGGLDGGQSTSVDIQFTVDSPLAAGTTLTNFAEIGFAFGGTFTFVQDVDSDPDSFNDDLYLIDNYIDGDGKNGGDEDDHDAASVTVEVFDFDLALYKILAPGESNIVQPGDAVDYQIVVINQGDITADNIEVSDSIPTGMTLMDANWMLSGSVATRTLNAGDELPIAGLEPGQTVLVTITLEVPMSLVTNTRLVNLAEISSATDINGNATIDVDSDMDDNFSNDTYLIDNYIDGNGKNGGDEDDHDQAEVMYEVFDLAIRKTYDDAAPIAHGDTIEYTITVFNQGTIPAQDIEIYDYIPDGMAYNPLVDFNGWAYAGSADVVRQEIEDVLQPGDSSKIYITLIVSDNVCSEDLLNTVEITNQEDIFGQNMNNNDIDSYPDKNPDNDTVEDDVIVGNGLNVPGEDEDDHDIELPNIFDLALRLTTTQTDPIQIGDEVPYNIEIFNQGSMKAMNTEVTVTLPTGFVLSGNNTNAWVDNGDGTATLTWPAMILPSDSTEFEILLEVTSGANQGDLITDAEIESAQDMAGNVYTTEDLDSNYDTDPTNDLLVDDEINSCGLIDEDDHDIATVELFDLALRKTSNTSDQVAWGEDVDFTITVFNQSPSLSAQDVALIDYIPAGFILSPNDANGWADLGATATQTISGPIASGDSAKIEITLQVVSGTGYGIYFNTAEITNASDDSGRDLTNFDFDSQPDTDNSDLLVDDEINDDGTIDEDDHDVAPVEIEIIDLAIRKTTTQTNPVLYGQDVLFTITIFNQGSVAMQNIEVIDYVPDGFELSVNDGNGWVFDAFASTATTAYAGLIQPQDSAKIDILLTVNQGAAPYTFENAAEIVSAEDETGTVRDGDDIDSDWDTDNTDLVIDNVIDQNGLIGEDEDDHDIADVQIFDLALSKTTYQTNSITFGDTVTFNINIFNQGMIAAQNVEIIDHLPTGFVLSALDANGWIDNMDGSYSTTYLGVIAPQTSVTIPIILEVSSSAQVGTFNNIAEIVSAQNDNGQVMTGFDVDSEYDEIPDNDLVVDDEINDDGTIDDDDHDIAPIEVEIIDLALRKVLQLGVDQTTIKIGDDVTFAIEIFNQGSVTMDTVYVVDYIPEGFVLSPTDGNGWNLIGDKAYNTVVGPLDPNNSISIGIVLRVDEDAAPDNVTNAAEIFGSVDIDGKIRTNDDLDSDADDTNDDIVIDDEILLMNPDDEDDHDVATAPVFDLALRKTTDQVDYVVPGDTVTYTVTVFNQGSIAATNIEVEDRLPQGFILSGADANGWVALNDSTATVTLAGSLAVGDSVKVDIDLYVTTSVIGGGILNNYAEITAAEDGNFNDMTNFDLDSEPNTDNFDDTLVDNVINENGVGNQDEDDHDIEPVEVQVIDLALRKTTNQVNPVEVGDDVIFEIEVFNQGSVTIDNIELIDFYPPGFSLSVNDGNGWTDNGNGSASLTLSTSIDGGLSTTIGIVLTLDAKVEFGTLLNFAELTRFEDAGGNDVTLMDIDSKADEDPTNDPIVDNEINEDPLIDEDDSDIASIIVNGFDFALTKTTSLQSFSPGDTVRFDLTIYNQGNQTGYDIQISDSIPTGLVLVDTEWTQTGDIATLINPIDSLEADSVLIVSIDLMIANDFLLDSLTNVAEISQVLDDMGGVVQDIDSDADDNFNNDPVVDNEINDDGTLDEDDHDIETIRIEQIFDLALWKKLGVGQNNLVLPGDTVRFTIFVTNQGTLPAYNVEITDYLEAGLNWDVALNAALNTSNANDWNADTTYSIAGSIQPSDTVSVDVFVIIDSNTSAATLTNTAEISAADNDTDPGNMPIADTDSFADDVNDDFVGGNDFILNENMDEDDHDVETIAIMELPVGSIAGLAWFDCDKDGIRDAGETLLPTVPVELIGTEFDGDPVSLTSSTAVDGSYSFIDLAPGDYVVNFGYPITPSGLLITIPNQGSDDNIDSDADQLTGNSHTIMLFGETITNVDAGYQDNEAPIVISQYPELDTTTIEWGSIIDFLPLDATATDNITASKDIIITVNVIDAFVADSCELDGFVKIIEVTWTATDECGNSYDYISYFRVIDTTPPVLVSNPPADISIECGSDFPTELPVFIDSCDDSLRWEVASSINPTNCGFVTVRTWFVYDDCGNSNSFSQTINEIDTTDPIILGVPDDITAECGAIPFIIFNVSAIDFCDKDVMLTDTTYQVGNDSCVGYEILHIWTATDDCGNMASDTMRIFVDDTEAPSLANVPADLTIECTSTPPVFPFPDVFDICDQDPTIDLEIEEVGNAICGSILLYKWTATDECGNTASDTTTVNLQDQTAPVIVGVPADFSLSCEEECPPVPQIIVTDNCDNDPTILFEEEIEGDTTSCTWQKVWTWKVFDACNNLTEAKTTITFIDTVAPIIIPLNPDLIGLMDGDTLMFECGNVPLYDEFDVSAFDNCMNVVDITLMEMVVNEDCTQNGVLFVMECIWKATDACGNVGTWTIFVKVSDTTPPMLTGPIMDMTVECDMVPDTATVTVVDNCDDNPIVVFDEQRIDGDCLYEYTLNRFWTLTDECGNDTTYTQVIMVIDTTGPVFTNIPADVTIECDVVLPTDEPIATDNCDDKLSIAFSEVTTPGSCDQEIVITKTWTATDACGNENTVIQIITIEDNIAPVFTFFPMDVTIECGDPIPTEEPVVMDNCDPMPSISMMETESPGICPQEKVIFRAWTVTDDCGNSISQTQRISIEDNTAPVFTNVPADITVECDQIPPASSTPMVTDNCDNDVMVTVDGEIIPGDCEYEYTLKRTWTAIDDCGNITVASQLISVEDTTPPVFVNVPADITVDCDNIPPIEDCDATDNCDVDVFTFSEEEIGAIIPGQNGCAYELLRSWKAVDDCGNQTVYVQTITVIDNEAPVITPIDPSLIGLMDGDTVMLECQDLPVLDTSDIMVTDNCCDDIDIDFFEIISNGDCEEDGYLMIMTCGWIATDCCGNESTFVIHVKVIDETNPMLMAIPDDVTVECDELPVFPFVTAMDNCDNNVDIDVNEDISDGNCDDSYTIIRTWTATDDCGNFVTDSQTITVQDTTDPVFTNIPADITVDCDQPLPIGDPIASDNCDQDVTVAYDEVTTQGCPYTVTRTWTATDNCGNSTTVTQVITINDDTPPTVDAPADVTIECGEPLPTDDAIISDLCDDDLQITFAETTEDLPCGQKITRTWTAEDNCGNIGEGVQMITITDVTDPEFVNTPQDITVDCDNIPDAEDCIATDNCDQDVETTFSEVVDDSDPCELIINRTWTAIDDCGNTNTIGQVITVIDNTGPTITPIHPELVGVMNGDTLMYECSTTTIFGENDVEVTDGCSTPTYEFVELVTDVGDCDQDGYLFIIRCCWIAEDACGNTSEFCIYVKITDETAPMIMDIPADITVECHEITDPTMDVMAMDECDDNPEISFSEFIEPGDCDGNFIIRREWTATDDCGNETIGTQIVTVEDNTPPLIVGVMGDITVECGNVPDVDDVKAIDNCDTDPSLDLVEETTGDCPYIITRTWTATDDCGNMSTMTQVITVEDTEMPVLVGIPDDLMIECIGDIPSPANVTATDNCDDDLDMTYSEEVIGDPCDQVITRTWTATDDCGNTIVGEQVITVRDDEAPVLMGVPDDLDFECEVDILDPTTVTATDNCDNDVEITYSEDTVGDACDLVITRTWTAMDDCGNTTVEEQIITVTDDESPVLVGIPDDITVDCTDIPDPSSVTATDNCDIDVEITLTEDAPSDSCNYQLIRTWTATDDCGNEVSGTQIITVLDDEAPVFTNIPADITVDCSDIPEVTDCPATDNCDDNLTFQFIELVGAGDCEFEIKRIWTAEDDCGNLAIVEQIITVIDETAPTLTFTNPLLQGLEDGDLLIIECDDLEFFNEGDATAEDDCDDNPQIMFMEGAPILGDCETDGFITEIACTWIAKDDCGNETSITLTIRVVDTVDPVFVNVPADITIDCDGDIPTAIDPEIEDCSDVAIELTEDTDVNGCTTIVTRIWTATDDCGNVSTATQVITRTDSTAPIFANVPSDITIDCTDDLPTDEPTVSDNCGNVDLVSDEDTQVNGCTTIVTRTWTATDDCGNVSTATQVIARTDSTAPIFANVPSDITIDCTDDLPTDEPTVSDNCNGFELTADENTEIGDCPEAFTIIRTWTAEDDCGNISTATQIITIEDNTAPTLAGVPADLIVNVDNGETVPPPPNVSVIDNCDADMDVVFEETQDQGQCENIITRTWTAIDDCGNVVSEMQVITVIMDNLGAQVISVTAETCDENDGTAELSPQSLNYLWSDGGSGFSRVDLPAGTYMITASNSTGCENTLTLTIENDCNCIEPFVDQLVLTATSCGEDNGAAMINVSGNPDDYIFTWSPDLGTPINGNAYERGNLPAGDYSVTITNPLFVDCETTVDFTIEPSDPVSVDVNVLPETCTGNDGLVTFTPANYTYTWEDQFVGSIRGNLAAGSYNVTITTPDNCVTIETVIVQLDCGCIEPIIEEEILTHTTCGEDNGVATIILEQDETLYNFDWIPNLGSPITQVDNSRTDLPPGDYLVIITFGDNDTCETKANFTILPSDPVVVSVEENNPETCEGNDGKVILSPANLTYSWSDGGSGFSRNDLTAGSYEVTATNSEGCSIIITIDVINNGLLGVEITTNINADCESANGQVVLEPIDYNYEWSDGGMGNERNDLAAGIYTVTATGSNPNCTGLVTVVVEEDPCPDCPTWFYQDTMLVELPDTGAASLCISIPHMVIDDLDIVLNGTDYTTPIDSCNSVSVVFYTYAMVIINNWNGPYGIEWEYEGTVYTDTLNTIDALVVFMNNIDATGLWMNDVSSTTLVGGDIDANYGDLTIFDIQTQQSGTMQQNTTVLPMGSELLFQGIGTYELIVTDSIGCMDTLIVIVEDNITPMPINFIAAEFASASRDCQDGLPSICVEIPYDELSDYSITNNGIPFTGTMEACNFESNNYYNYINLPGLGNDGPYKVESWILNGETFTGTFNSIDDLLAQMNLWDTQGEWTNDLVGFNLVGGTSSSAYGAMTISQVSTGIVNVVQVNTNVIPNATAFILEPGMNELIVTRLSDGVSDTLMAAIACVTSEYMYNEIAISQKDTICLDTDELMGAITEVYNICEDQMTDAAEFIIIDGMNCISCLGMEEGNSEACIVVCDEYGICDTTFLFVDVRALDDPTTTKDTLHTQMDRIVIGDILSNDGIPDDLISFEIIRQPDNGNVIVNPDNTVSYEPFEGYCNSFEGGEPDFFMYQICTDGGCTSGVVYVYVDCGKLIFYNGFSPNGDGVNDVFKIEGIGQFPNNKLCVYNRWGNKVYCVDDYQNDWGGTWNTNDLPDGTYFYVFETGEGDRYTGYVQINR
ncbi:MAG: gliding motility-associated C-terminal domain-containing protein [Bacteroidetes bacterium]|nr:gliding motility-associated C-terminal domain-containing protein [Bacteroidota bacterium]